MKLAPMQPRVLVVDDEKNVLFAVRDYFDSVGLEVDCASDLAESKELLDRHHYAVAIVDIRLGGSDDQDGLTLLRVIRERQLDTRTVILTAYGAEFIREVEHLAVDAFFRKPKPLRELARTVFELSGAQPPARLR